MSLLKVKTDTFLQFSNKKIVAKNLTLAISQGFEK
jgi:hypothetical protein